MTSVFKYLLFLLLLILLKSCGIDEKTDNVYSGMVNLDINIKALDPAVKIRIIITDADNGKILINNKELDLSKTYRTKVKTGKLNIYIIGNESTRVTALFDNLWFEDDILPLTLLRNEVPNAELPPNSTTNSNLPLMRVASVLVKAENYDPETGLVSSDNGATWSSLLNIALERLAVKTSLKIRKETTPETDVVKIQEVRIVNIPLHSHWLPRSYQENTFHSPEYPYNSNSGISITTNEDDFTTIFEDYVIPEYLPADPSDENTAMTMEIHALYNQEEKIYYIPLQTQPEAGTYSLTRNSQHVINATIISEEEIIAYPEIDYEVLGWNDAGSIFEYGSIIQFSKRWSEKVNLDGKNIYVAANEVLELKFSLTNPAGSIWKATLSNPIDFEFDYSNDGVSSGLGGTNIERIIRIRPRKGTRANGIKTELYIMVNYGPEYVELDLPNEIVGAGNRYIITQIPD